MDTPAGFEGTLIGGYRFESMIGSGGMGQVYRAVHAKLGRKAAVKVLSDSLAANPEYVSRFFREARIVTSVGHPNIIDILDFVELESPRVVAYVMELIEGPSLAQVLKSGPLPPVQAINIALQLLDALMAVHAIDVVHRDLKPENILIVGSLDTDLSARPCIKVLDFGIAKINDRDGKPQSFDGHHTSTGMVLGTPAYMAPEQVAADVVSPATDVYAVGELLFEMITGRRLFTGDNRAILRGKLSESPPVIELPAGIAGGAKLANMIRACLAQDQKKRPALPLLSAALHDVLEQQPTLSGGTAVARAQDAWSEATDTSPRVVFDDDREERGSRSWMVIVSIAIFAIVLFGVSAAIFVLRETEAIVILPSEPDQTPAPPVRRVEEPVVVEQPPVVKKKASSKRSSDPLKRDEFPDW